LKNKSTVGITLGKVKWVFTLVVIAVSIKLFLQLGSTVHFLSDLAFSFRPIVIGYLHLVLLGVITLFIIGYVLAQLVGAAMGAWIAHAMFELEIWQWSVKVRTGPAQWFAEAVATAGLLFVILRSPSGKASSLVACYIGAAYWFTASTSFANPAAAFGRMFSNTFAGISPADVPAFVVAQIVGGFLGMMLHLLLKSDHSQHQ
ncbi:MAG: hypothetical protein RL281_806, partial [Pseudomonadota bacterium]